MQRHTISRLQTLVSSGTKDLVPKWDRQGILRVKVYDFALYANPSHLSATFSSPQLHDTAAARVHEAGSQALAEAQRPRSRRRLIFRRLPGHGLRSAVRTRAPAQPSLTSQVRAAAGDVSMSLYVRPARDLPLLMLRAEHGRILRRRMRAVGGSPDDPALQTLLSCFNAAALPVGVTRRGCVRRGSALLFSRSRSGRLCATADGAAVATVHSPKLCEAVFDLYLGEAPVCREAKAQARVALERMLGMHAAPSSAVAPSALPTRRLQVDV